MKRLMAMIALVLLVGCGTKLMGLSQEAPIEVVVIEEVPAEVEQMIQTSKFKETVPFVEGENYNYLVITMGEMPTSGYAVSFDGYNVTDDQLVISYSFQSPNPNEAVLQVLTYPYLVLQITKTDKQIVMSKVEETIGGNIFIDPKVGDFVVGMEITEAKMSKEPVYTGTVSFKNEVTVKGTYRYDPLHEFLDGIMFIVDEESLPFIPKLAWDERMVWFAFGNDREARNWLGVTDGVAQEGQSTIVIDEYQINYMLTEIWNMAKLVKVIE